ncbi:Hydroxysteroid 17-beta dehydrogenase 11 [Phaffia rhodozyma]|uniref:Hydroxysteroid 17-beta dehydrogenase 11 n=1 Tax=Phaffia rhodozyma TaxID=264483 RepID=A0A0F7SF59_PHARH|nr:Hydroxysteroid 17-beta dehydrogenase 11 [Phaffia rhodozyma]
MTDISSSEAAAYGSRLKNQTVVLTGAASGIGREVAIRFGSFGANLVLGDLNEDGLRKVSKEVEQAGGKSVWSICDVTKWEDQVELFKLGFKTFGSINVVLPNAGVTELAEFKEEDSQGEPLPPNLKTLEINLHAPLYSSSLAFHYFARQPVSTASLRSLVITGSMASLFGTRPEAVQYSASKAGVLGLMNGMKERSETEKVRLGLICPYYVQTPLLPTDFKPQVGNFSKIQDVVSAFLHASTHPDPKTSASLYTIPDERGVFMIKQREQIPAGLAQRWSAKKAAKSRL